MLDFAGGAEVVCCVCLFPGELGEFAAEVAVVCSFLEDRSAQVEAFLDVVGAHVEYIGDGFGQLFVGDLACSA